MAYSEGLDAFLKFLRTAEADYRIAELDLEEADAETQDILHKLELDETPYHTKAKLAKALVDVRKKRRQAKNALSELAPIVEFKDKNGNTLSRISDILGTVRNLEKKNKAASYHPKTTIVHDILDKGKEGK